MQNHRDESFSDTDPEQTFKINTEHEKIPDDLKDSLVSPANDIGLLTDDWAKKKVEFFFSL